MGDAGTITVKLRAATTGFQKAIRRAGEEIKWLKMKTEEGVGPIARTNTALAKISPSALGAAAGFAALGFAAKKATGIFADFESGMTRVGAVTNSIGTESMGAMTTAALEMSKTTEFSARQVADAMGFLGQAGRSANEVISQTPAVLQLASAAMIDVGRAADIVTNVMSGYGLTAAQLTNANNVLVATMTNSNTSLEQLGAAFKFVGPVAKAAGVAFDETSAAIGILGDAGIQGEMAGTAIRGGLVKLINPSKDAAKTIKRLGLDSFITANGVTSLTDVVRQLEKSGATTADMMKIFAQRAGPAMQVLVDRGADAIDRLRKKIELSGNIAERIAGQQLKTLSGQIKIMKSQFEAAAIDIGQTWVPLLKDTLIPLMSKTATFAGWLGRKMLSLGADDILGGETKEDVLADKLSRRREVIDKLERSLANLQASSSVTVFKDKDALARVKRLRENIARLKGDFKIAAGAANDLIKPTQDAADASEDFSDKLKEAKKAADSVAETLKDIIAGQDIILKVELLAEESGTRRAEIIKGTRDAGLLGERFADLESATEIQTRNVLATAKSFRDLTDAADVAVSKGLVSQEVADEMVNEIADGFKPLHKPVENLSKVMGDFVDPSRLARDELIRLGKEAKAASDSIANLSAGELVGGEISGGMMRDILKNSFGVKGNLSKVLGEVIGSAIDGGSLSESLGSAIGALASKAFKLPAGVGKVLGKAAGGIVDSIMGSLGSILGMVGEGVGNLVSSAISTLMSAVGAISSTVQDSLGAAFSDKRVDDVSKSLGSLVFGFGILTSAAIGLAAITGPGILVLGPLFAALGGIATVATGLTVTMFRLAQETESFKKFQTAFGNALDKLTQSVEPLFQKLLPLVGVVDVVVEAFASVIGSLLETFQLGFLFNVFKQFAIFTLQGAIAIGHFTNFMGGAVQMLAPVFGGIADILDDFGARIELAGLQIGKWWKDITGQTTPESMQAFVEKTQQLAARLGTASSEAGDQIRMLGEVAGSNVIDVDALSEALQVVTNMTLGEARERAEALLALEETNESFNEGLLNIPEGFKVAEARFRAIVPELGEPPPGPGNAASGAQAVTISMANVTVVANDPEEFITQVAGIAETEAIQQTGTPLLNARQVNNGNQ